MVPSSWGLSAWRAGQRILAYACEEAALEVYPGLEGAESSGQQAYPGTWGWNVGNGKLA